MRFRTHLNPWIFVAACLAAAMATVGWPVSLASSNKDGKPLAASPAKYHAPDNAPAAQPVLAGGGRLEQPSQPVGASLSNWKTGREYILDGISDHVRVDDHSEFRVSALTLAAWIHTRDAMRTQPVVAKAQAKGNWVSYMLRIGDGGKVALVLGNHATDQDVHWQTKASVTSECWHHLAATWANRCADVSDAKIYIDGVEQEVRWVRNTGYGPAFKIGYSVGPLYIGRDEFPSGHFFGTLRDVEVLGRVLTSAEVKALAAKVPGVR
jgi:hypothetical protein